MATPRTVSAWLLSAALLALPGAAYSGGLIGGLIGFEPARAPDARGRYLPGCWALSQPAQMAPASPMVVVEYSSENLIRSKTNGVLTEDAGTSGRAMACYLPLGLARYRTVVALSEGSSSADLFSDNPKTGGQLGWNLDSSAWAIAQTLDKVRLGATASQFSGRARGGWAYAGEAFGILPAAPDTAFDVSGREVSYQLSCPLTAWARLLASTGTTRSSYNMRFAGAGSVISIPVSVQGRTRGWELQFDLGKRATATIGGDTSSGDGSTNVYLGSLAEGDLYPRARYSTFAGSLALRHSRKTDLLLGYVADARALDLRAVDVRGADLGTNLKPFNERIDFQARADLLDNFSYVGVRRKFSDRWGLDAVYKRVHIRSRLDVAYTGRAFFGLVGAGGSYSTTFFDSRAHALQLALRYAGKGLSATLAVEQLVPMSSGHGRPPSAAPRPKVEATGGTSFSLSVSYGI